jgi:hypothetical protein
MPTYQKAPADMREQVTAVMKTYHGQLRDAEVQVDVLLASPTVDANGDPTGPAVRVHGYAAAAFIRVLSYKDRVIRGFDAEMTLDADHWETASDAERIAVIDHELTHLELVTGDGGTVLRDNAERPKLRCRKHDRHFGWFDIVARRHGDHSLEVKQAREMLDSAQFTQCYLFDVGRDDETTSDDLGVELSTGGKSVKTTLGKIKKLANDLKTGKNGARKALKYAREKRNIQCSDGRHITPAEMVEEINRDFAGVS